MIIVSQDKTQILNFDNINYLYVSKIVDDNFAIEINYSDCNYNVIARYKTEERAKEVLQEIKNVFSFQEIKGSYQEIRAKLELAKCASYEMPKE